MSLVLGFNHVRFQDELPIVSNPYPHRTLFPFYERVEDWDNALETHFTGETLSAPYFVDKLVEAGKYAVLNVNITAYLKTGAGSGINTLALAIQSPFIPCSIGYGMARYRANISESNIGYTTGSAYTFPLKVVLRTGERLVLINGQNTNTAISIYGSIDAYVKNV